MLVLVFNSPQMGEESSYNRNRVPVELSSRTITARVRMVKSVSGDVMPPASTGVRIGIYTDPAQPPTYTPWLTGVGEAMGNLYSASIILPNGPFALYAETQQAGVASFGCSGIVNDSGAKLPSQAGFWVTDRRAEDFSLHRVEHPPKWVPLNIRKPTAKPFKARPATTPMSSLANAWSYSWGAHQRNVMFRRLEKTMLGDYTTVPEQKYSYYGEAVENETHRPGLDKPTAFTIKDGPRNVATTGYVTDGQLRRRGGRIWTESNGRVAFQQARAIALPPGIAPTRMTTGEGAVVSLAGWYLPDGVQQKSDGSSYVMAGDYSQMVGPKYMREPWAGELFSNLYPDGTRKTREGFTYDVADTLNHRLVRGDIGAGHPDLSSLGIVTMSDCMPAGYVQAATRGEVAWMHLLGNTDGTPSTYCNAPWGRRYCQFDGKMYHTNFLGDSLVRTNVDGSNPEFVIGGGAQKTDAQLGVGGWLQVSSVPLATHRAALVTGDAAAATLTRPQGFVFDDDGNAYIFLRYAFLIVKWTRATNQVSLWGVPSAANITQGAGSSYHHEGHLCISDGTVFPKGTIILTCWSDGHFKFDPNGGGFGRMMSASERHLRMGPMNQVDLSDYSFCSDIFANELSLWGNDAGAQEQVVVARTASDPTPSESAIIRGADAWAAYMASTHGAGGYGELGLPNVEDMGGWTDSAITAYLPVWGVPTASIADVITFVRWYTHHLDYTAPAPDTTPPAAPIASLTLVQVTYH